MAEREREDCSGIERRYYCSGNEGRGRVEVAERERESG